MTARSRRAGRCGAAACSVATSCAENWSASQAPDFGSKLVLSEFSVGLAAETRSAPGASSVAPMTPPLHASTAISMRR